MTTKFFPSPKAVAIVCLSTMMYAGGVLAQTKIDKGDADLLQDIARANIAEIETGKLAAEKSKNASVKKFAQMMVTDHTKGLADVKKVAAANGVDLPNSPDAMHKAAMLEFKALQGDTFDSRYIKQAGVGDHETTEKLLQKTQSDAKAADVKALADKMLPVVQAHLGHAREMAATKK
jgi:putative membrane protein